VTRALLAVALLALTLLGAPAARAEAQATAGDAVDITEQLGARVPRDLPFIDSSGRKLLLGERFAGRPVVLALVYYRCQGLCSLLLGGLAASLQKLEWQLGHELDVVTVSIDPDETPQLAAASRDGYLKTLGRTGEMDGWTSLVGPGASIDALAAAVGFHFQYFEGQRQFSHAAALFVLTPDGRVSRYLYGVEFPPRQLQSAVFEAAGGHVGTSFERVILRCFAWDPASRRYHLFLTRYFRGAGIVLIAAVGGLLAVLWRRDLQRSRA
jgi:protein SCO1/2